MRDRNHHHLIEHSLHVIWQAVWCPRRRPSAIAYGGSLSINDLPNALPATPELRSYKHTRGWYPIVEGAVRKGKCAEINAGLLVSTRSSIPYLYSN